MGYLIKFRNISLIKKVRGKIRNIIQLNYRLTFFALRNRPNLIRLLATKNTEIIIEGYPRSANTFAVVAFEIAQKRSVNIAHHLHIPAQIIFGIKKNIPIIVLIRNPIDAVISMKIREPKSSCKKLYSDYLRFYRVVHKYRSKLVIAKYETVIENFGKVINEVNNKYKKNFFIFEHSENNVALCFKKIKFLNHALEGSNNFKIALPNQTKEEKKTFIKEKIFDKKYKRYRLKCEYIYKQIIDNHAI